MRGIVNQGQWTAVDDYLNGMLVKTDPVLQATLEASVAANLPPHQVSPAQAKLLMLLAQIHRAERILEIGTLGGYSTIALARGLRPGGRLITLEINPHHAEVARANIARAQLADVVEVRLGPALDSLQKLATQREGPFDLIFVDADKSPSADYFSWALRLSRPGTLMVFDNVIREGQIIDASNTDPSVQGIRQLNAILAAEVRVSATAIQTVGCKGYDGFALVLVISASTGT